jgi:excisionase family DNA binding protein
MMPAEDVVRAVTIAKRLIYIVKQVLQAIDLGMDDPTRFGEQVEALRQELAAFDTLPLDVLYPAFTSVASSQALCGVAGANSLEVAWRLARDLLAELDMLRADTRVYLTAIQQARKATRRKKKQPSASPDEFGRAWLGQVMKHFTGDLREQYPERKDLRRITAAVEQEAVKVAGQKITAAVEQEAVKLAGQKPVGHRSWLTVSEAAMVSGISKGAISRLADAGTLKSNRQSGRDRRIDSADINRYQLERANRADQPESDEAVARKLAKAQQPRN